MKLKSANTKELYSIILSIVSILSAIFSMIALFLIKIYFICIISVIIGIVSGIISILLNRKYLLFSILGTIGNLMCLLSYFLLSA
ncbi:MAG: hypothetical protein IJZ64_02730 [Ruminococcus sp.]|nr:hypothetical protein [Ruminococcus sp.]